MSADRPESVTAVRDAIGRALRKAGVSEAEVAALDNSLGEVDRVVLRLERDIAAERIMRMKLAERGIELLDDMASCMEATVGVLRERTTPADHTHVASLADTFDAFYEEVVERLGELKPRP